MPRNLNQILISPLLYPNPRRVFVAILTIFLVFLIPVILIESKLTEVNAHFQNHPNDFSKNMLGTRDNLILPLKKTNSVIRLEFVIFAEVTIDSQENFSLKETTLQDQSAAYRALIMVFERKLSKNQINSQPTFISPFEKR